MPRFHLLRHAKAVAKGEAGDFERELSPRGRADALRLGAWLRDNDIRFDTVLTSPARRASETAELVLGELAAPPAPVFRGDLYDAGADRLRAALEAAGDGSILLVGHNPGIGDLARKFAEAAGGEANALLADGFPTCGLAIFETVPETKTSSAHGLRFVGYVTPDGRRVSGL